MRRTDVDDDAVLEDRVDAAQCRVVDRRLDAQLADAAGDVGEVLLGVAAHVERREVTVGPVGHVQLDLAIGGSEDTVTGAAHAASFPERSELARVRDAEFDVEESVERHHAPTLA